MESQISSADVIHDEVEFVWGSERVMQMDLSEYNKGE